MQTQIFDETNGLSYTLHGDYYLPDLELPAEEKIYLGKYGRAYQNYLKNHRKVIYTTLLTSGRLNQSCKEVEDRATERLGLLMKQMAKNEGITEQLKASDQMAWVGAMNNIKNRVEEIIFAEIIYV